VAAATLLAAIPPGETPKTLENRGLLSGTPRDRCGAPRRRRGVEVEMELQRITDGPRERLARDGASCLSDEELLALLLGTGSASEPVTVLAARALREAGGLHGLARLGVGGMAEIAGVGAARASRIVAAIELSRRVPGPAWSTRPRIDSSLSVDALVRARLAQEDVEHFVALALDVKNRVKAELRIATGGTSACAVSPADVYRALLREAATGAVFVHNHPSGDARPSADDVSFTQRLVGAGKVLGVRVVDHVIVARECYFSFLDAGLLRDLA
jgi:DNA repair protein RadC